MPVTPMALAGRIDMVPQSGVPKVCSRWRDPTQLGETRNPASLIRSAPGNVVQLRAESRNRLWIWVKCGGDATGIASGCPRLSFEEESALARALPH